MKMRIILSLAMLVATLAANATELDSSSETNEMAAGSRGGPPVYLPAMTKMLDAYEAWDAVRWNLLRTNSLEEAVAERIMARKYMAYCEDWLDAEAMRAAWPLAVEDFEKDLSRKLTQDNCGLYLVKGEYNDYGEGTTDAGNLAIKPSVRWMYRKGEEWATNALDKAFKRLSRDEVAGMLGEENINGGTYCWRIGTNEFFAIQINDEDCTFEAREYIYMCWDRKSDPKIGAVFNSLPDAKTMASVRGCYKGNPFARNNMAALLWNEVVNRGETYQDIIKRLLQAAKDSGVARAAENLRMMEGAQCSR